MKEGLVAQALPLYQCHKQVWALKIKEVIRDFPTIAELDSILEGQKPKGAILVPEDETYARFEVSQEYFLKHEPHPGGYYVQYKDGYESFSPAQAFEEGYTLIS